MNDATEAGNPENARRTVQPRRARPRNPATSSDVKKPENTNDANKAEAVAAIGPDYTTFRARETR